MFLSPLSVQHHQHRGACKSLRIEEPLYRNGQQSVIVTAQFLFFDGLSHGFVPVFKNSYFMKLTIDMCRKYVVLFFLTCAIFFNDYCFKIEQFSLSDLIACYIY
jgi:hypothetical protein